MLIAPAHSSLKSLRKDSSAWIRIKQPPFSCTPYVQIVGYQGATFWLSLRF